MSGGSQRLASVPTNVGIEEWPLRSKREDLAWPILLTKGDRMWRLWFWGPPAHDLLFHAPISTFAHPKMSTPTTCRTAKHRNSRATQETPPACGKARAHGKRESDSLEIVDCSVHRCIEVFLRKVGAVGVFKVDTIANVAPKCRRHGHIAFAHQFRASRFNNS